MSKRSVGVITFVGALVIGACALVTSDTPSSEQTSPKTSTTTVVTMLSRSEGTGLSEETVSDETGEVVETLPESVTLPEESTPLPTTKSVTLAEPGSDEVVAIGPTPTSPAETRHGERQNTHSVEEVAPLFTEDTSVGSSGSDGSSATKDVVPQEPAPLEPDPLDPGGSVDGPTYTWNNGDGTLQVTLQPGLTVGEDGSVIPRTGGAGAAGQAGSVPRGEGSSGGQAPGLPVFRSPSGTLMTLPGGVLLSLDREWSRLETDDFFATNGIALDRVSELGWLPNGFLIETEPGFPSLNLANALAGQEGVEFSSPNWWTQKTTK